VSRAGTAATLLGAALVACVPTAKEPSPSDRLIFPTGLALSPDGTRLAVLSSNFDLKFRDGRLHVLDTAAIADADTLAAAQKSHAEMGSFGGYVKWNAAGTRLYATARGDDLLVSADVAADGKLTCLGGGAADDCTAGLDTLAGGITSPFGVAVGEVVQPVLNLRREFVFFTQLAPTANAAGTAFEARIAGVAAADPLGADFKQGSFTAVLGAEGAGPMAYDAARGRLVVAGCYTRVTGGVTPCGLDHGKNPLRIVYPTPYGAAVEEHDLMPLVRSAQTGGVALSSDGKVAYLTVRAPDALAEIELPEPGAFPVVRRLVPLSAGASNLAVVARPGGADLVSVASATAGTVAIYDAGTGAVVAELRPQKSAKEQTVPFDVAGRVSGGRAEFFVSLFRACGLVRVDVPLDAPWNAAVGARLGACP
jgi:DNA-binding beta-propeller fold protein YncE